MSRTCVIFDLDGTLVDSEGLCNRAFLDLLPDLGDGIDAMIRRYRGRKLREILIDLEARLDRSLPLDFEMHYRARVSELFEAELEPTPGTPEMLESLTLPYCIASSGPEKKIWQALRASGLRPLFHGPIFSSYTVGSWKPDPGLFLHAAREMGFDPDECVVIDDSPVGVEAARAAGMRVLRFTPDEAIEGGDCFGSMTDLPRLLDDIASRFDHEATMPPTTRRS